MAKAQYFVRMDTYYQGARDVWYGPYQSRDAARQAMDASECGRSDLGQGAADIKNQARCLGIYTATKSRQIGRRWSNTCPAVNTMPSTIDELRRDEDRYLPYL